MRTASTSGHRTHVGLRLLGSLLLLLAALWCLERAAFGQGVARFHRYAMTRLDDTTMLDLVKDARTQTCVLVYVSVNHFPSFASNARAVTSLGPVPCDPPPVPPASGVR